MKNLRVFGIIASILLLLKLVPLVYAGVQISLSNPVSGQKTDVTVSITGHNCGTEANGELSKDTFTIGSVKIITQLIATGRPALDLVSGNTVVTKNGQNLSGSYNNYGLWQASPPFAYTFGDKVVVQIYGAKVLGTGKAEVSAYLEQTNTNDCIGSSIVSGNFENVIQLRGATVSTPTSTVTIAPLPTEIVNRPNNVETTNPQPRSFLVNIIDIFKSFLAAILRIR